MNSAVVNFNKELYRDWSITVDETGKTNTMDNNTSAEDAAYSKESASANAESVANLTSGLKDILGMVDSDHGALPEDMADHPKTAEEDKGIHVTSDVAANPDTNSIQWTHIGDREYVGELLAKKSFLDRQARRLLEAEKWLDKQIYKTGNTALGDVVPNKQLEELHNYYKEAQKDKEISEKQLHQTESLSQYSLGASAATVSGAKFKDSNSHARSVQERLQIQADLHVAEKMQEEEVKESRDETRKTEDLEKGDEVEEGELEKLSQRIEQLGLEELSLRKEEEEREKEAKVYKLRREVKMREDRLRNLRDRLDAANLDCFLRTSDGYDDSLEYETTVGFRPERGSTPFPDALRHQPRSLNLPSEYNDTYSVAPRNKSKRLPSAATDVSDFEKTAAMLGGLTEEDYKRISSVGKNSSQSVLNSSTTSFVITRSKSDVSSFSGDIVDYPDFKSSFDSYMSQFPRAEHIDTLKSKLGKHSNLLVGCSGGTDRDLDKAWRILDSHFNDKLKLRKELISQIQTFLMQHHTKTDAIEAMLMQVRDRFERLVRVDPTAAIVINEYKDDLLRALPLWLGRKFLNRDDDPKDEFKLSFPSILKAAEEAIPQIRRQEFHLGSASKPDRGNKAVVTALPAEQELDQDSQGGEEDEIDADLNAMQGQSKGFNQNRRGNSSERGFYRGQGRGRGYGSFNNRLPQNKTRSQIRRPDMAYPDAQCMICDVNDHITVECQLIPNVEPKKLKEMVDSRSICVFCGRPDHRVKSCAMFMVTPKNPLACLDKECGPNFPHAKAFCKLYKNV